MTKNLKLALRILVSLVLIFLLFKLGRISPQLVFSNLKEANYFVVLVFGAHFINYLFSAFRWKALIIYKTKTRVTIPYLLKLYYIGSFLGNFMPTNVGGDVYKAYKLGKDTGNMSGAVAATFMERLLGVVSLSVISSASLVAFWGVRGVLVFFVFWILIIAGFLGLWIISRFIGIFKKFHDAVWFYKESKKAVLKALFFSLFVQIGAIFSHFFTSLSLGISIPIAFAFFAFPVIGFISFLPISISGIGVQDNIYVFIFEKIGISAAMAASASILYHALRILNSLIGWLFLTFDKDFRGSISFGGDEEDI